MIPLTLSFGPLVVDDRHAAVQFEILVAGARAAAISFQDFTKAALELCEVPTKPKVTATNVGQLMAVAHPEMQPLVNIDGTTEKYVPTGKFIWYCPRCRRQNIVKAFCVDDVQCAVKRCGATVTLEYELSGTIALPPPASVVPTAEPIRKIIKL